MLSLASPRSTIAIGAVLAVAAFLAPAFAPKAGPAVLLPAVLPISFLAAGGVAEALRAGHPIGLALGRVGMLHLAGLVASVVAVRTGAIQRWPPASAPSRFWRSPSAS